MTIETTQEELLARWQLKQSENAAAWYTELSAEQREELHGQVYRHLLAGITEQQSLTEQDEDFLAILKLLDNNLDLLNSLGELIG